MTARELHPEHVARITRWSAADWHRVIDAADHTVNRVYGQADNRYGVDRRDAYAFLVWEMSRLPSLAKLGDRGTVVVAKDRFRERYLARHLKQQPLPDLPYGDTIPTGTRPVSTEDDDDGEAPQQCPTIVGAYHQGRYHDWHSGCGCTTGRLRHTARHLESLLEAAVRRYGHTIGSPSPKGITPTTPDVVWAVNEMHRRPFVESGPGHNQHDVYTGHRKLPKHGYEDEDS